MVSGPMLEQITQLLYSELSKKSKRPEAGRQSASTLAGRESSQRGSSAGSGPAALRTRLENLASSGMTDEFFFIRSAVEFFLQQEFGHTFTNTPQFQELTEKTAQTILQDGAVRAALTGMLRR